MPDVLICYEHIQREVANATMLKYELERRGLSCHIMHFNGPGFYHYSKRKNRAKVVLCPWLRHNDNVYHYLKLADKMNRLVDIQCEQVYNEKGIASGLCKIAGESIKASHLCWGENSFKRLVDCGVKPEHLPVTGAIQLDYGRELFKNYYLPREEISRQYGLDNSKRWCLFVSSFGYANYDENGIREQVKLFGEHILNLVKMHKASQSIVLDWIEKLLSSIDCEFIYRPHPSENLCARLNEIQKNHSNFHIISDYSVNQWAKVADSVNLWYSTSNAEIVSLGVNYEIIRPIKIPDELEIESMRQEKHITSCDDFVRFNEGDWRLSYDIQQRRDMLRYYYSNISNDFSACEKIIDYIESLIKDEKIMSFKFKFSETLRYEKLEISKRVISFIMETQIRYPRYRFIEKLPLKKIIRKNLVRKVDLYYQMLETQRKMDDYLSAIL